MQDELAILVEDLDAMVGSIRDEHAARSIHGNRVRHLEFARLASPGPPGRQELSVLVELHDARIRVAVGDEETSVRQPCDARRSAEVLLVIAFDTRFAECTDEPLAIVREHEDLLLPIVDDPDVPLRVVWTDVDAVRPAAALEETVPLRPRLEHPAFAVDDDDAIADLGRRVDGLAQQVGTVPQLAPLPGV